MKFERAQSEGCALVVVNLARCYNNANEKEATQMKMLPILGTITSIVILLSIAGCTTPVPPEGQAPDDIVPAPGLGPTYRANIQQQGVKNPWPSIKSTEVTLGDAQVAYRDYIETRAGETRNNIFSVYRPNQEIGTVTLQGIDLPDGITIVQGDLQYHGVTATRTKTSVAIEISAAVKPAEYTFYIGVDIDGTDYGDVSCTIKVLK